MTQSNEELKPSSEAPKDKKEEELKKSEAPQTGEPEEKKEGEPVVDYKAELEKAKEQTENYKTGLSNEKEISKRRQEKIDKLEKEEPKKEEIDTSTILTQVRDVVREELTVSKREDQADFVNEVENSMSDNPDERELIRHYYDNSLIKTGSSKENIIGDFQKAKVLANQSKYLKENGELKAALLAKGSKTSGGMGSSEKAPVEDKTQPTDEDIRIANATFGGDIERYMKHKDRT